MWCVCVEMVISMVGLLRLGMEVVIIKHAGHGWDLVACRKMSEQFPSAR